MIPSIHSTAWKMPLEITRCHPSAMSLLPRTLEICAQSLRSAAQANSLQLDQSTYVGINLERITPYILHHPNPLVYDLKSRTPTPFIFWWGNLLQRWLEMVNSQHTHATLCSDHLQVWETLNLFTLPSSFAHYCTRSKKRC